MLVININEQIFVPYIESLNLNLGYSLSSYKTRDCAKHIKTLTHTCQTHTLLIMSFHVDIMGLME